MIAGQLGPTPGAMITPCYRDPTPGSKSMERFFCVHPCHSPLQFADLPIKCEALLFQQGGK